MKFQQGKHYLINLKHFRMLHQSSIGHDVLKVIIMLYKSMFSVYAFNNVIQRYRIQKINVLLYWLLKKLGKKGSRPQFKQWTMKKVMVDQLYPTIGPSLGHEYQDESGDDGDKGTIKKLG